MTVPMDGARAPPSQEQAQRLFKKNVELENGLRKSTQAKVPSDPSAWDQMRENYEQIILEDNGFSEKHEVEYLLWQLHYRRIEEFRQHLSAAASAESNASQGVKGQARPDRIRKIRSVFKNFLTEATGFYHELILKIRTKYGLPLSYFSDGPENQISSAKDEKRSAELKKGLTSCHRCLIYLGDLARYKGIYGEGDSVSRDYGSASSYYMQAVSLFPSSGNPHHQLAILASYSGDDTLALYRYFRSLAVENPFSTARDNLIIAFEKNRQRYSQLHVNVTTSFGRTLPTRQSRKARGEGRPMTKYTKTEDASMTEQEVTIPEVLKSFSTRFVHLNGILFTKTSLETFGEIFSAVTTDLHVLLASGPGEDLHFGHDAAENAYFVLRLVAIVIFTVHNVKRESENQSYAEILQRTLLLQNAFTAAFEIAGYIVKRCTELVDFSSSYLLPAILVFIEWLACHPDIAGGSNVEDKRARSFFWNHCILFMNNIISSDLAALDGEEDESCFVNMSRYDEGETDNRRALWEDFELRGFLPLVPAQTILDFSRKHGFLNNVNMQDMKSRAQRILAAGRALTGVVQVDRQRIYIDPSIKKFVLALDPPVLEDLDSSTFCSAPAVSAPVDQKCKVGSTSDIVGKQHNASGHGMMKLEPELCMNGEVEGEEIVFKPTVSEKYPNGSGLESSTNDSGNPVKVSSPGNWISSGSKIPASLEAMQFSTVSNDASHCKPITPDVSQLNFQYPDDCSHLNQFVAPNISQLPFQYRNPETSRWFMKQERLLSDSLYNMNIKESGHLNRLQEGLGNVQPTTAYSTAFSAAANPVTSTIFPSQSGKAVTSTIFPSQSGEAVLLPRSLDSVVPSVVMSDSLAVKSSVASPVPRKNPVGRPTRHVGPPPGFSNASAKQQDETNHYSGINVQRSEVDGYRSISAKGAGLENSSTQPFHVLPPPVSDTFDPFIGASGFPFPGKQVSNMQTPIVNDRNWPDFQLFEQPKPYAERQIQHTSSQQSLLPQQHEAKSLCSSQYFV